MNDQTKDISVQAVLPHPVHVVWKTLTTSELIAQWLMPNDFEPIIGKKFNFKSKPMGDWDGVVYCEVLEIVENSRLVYSWKGGSGDSALDTTVAWTLTPIEAGTKLEMVHSGFRLPGNQIALDAMTPGWGQVTKRIERAVEQLARA
jgi:uncharacterized protein YndB with AHSA1/START domain